MGKNFSIFRTDRCFFWIIYCDCQYIILLIELSEVEELHDTCQHMCYFVAVEDL